MNITKCDMCKKTIENYNHEIWVTHYGTIDSLSFCIKCAMPIVKFLNKYHFLDESSKVKLASLA